MSYGQLSSGKWRARVWDRSTSKYVPAGPVLGLPEGTTWPNKTAARKARDKAKAILDDQRHTTVTVREFWEQWTTDPLYARPKDSTNIHNKERTKAFVIAHGDLKPGFRS